LPNGQISIGLLLAFVGLTAFPLWLGYQIRAWRKPTSTVPVKSEVEGLPDKGPFVVSIKQYKYREEVRADLLRIHSELYQIAAGSNPILFKSWNETIDHTFKHELIAIIEQDKAIERFSTALNHRNSNLHTPKFEELNDECIAQYAAIRETGFFDVALEKPQAARILLEVEALKEITLAFQITSTTEWFDIGIENGKLIDIGKWQVSAGNIESDPVLHENYFTINHAKFPFLKMRIKATFKLPPNNAVCLLRKADSGHFTVDVESGVFPFRSHPFLPSASKTVGKCDYAKSLKPKNEKTFPLDKI